MSRSVMRFCQGGLLAAFHEIPRLLCQREAECSSNKQQKRLAEFRWIAAR